MQTVVRQLKGQNLQTSEMEVIYHFVFELGKIIMLSCVYAALTFGFFKFIAILKPNGWADRISKDKIRFWVLSVLTISLGLFIFMFTYWGNHGLGDGPRIPIGYGVVVDNTNWTAYGYVEDIKTSDGLDIEMTNFKVADDKLIGNLSSSFSDFKKAFFVYGLKTKKMTEFKTKSEFDEYAVKNNLPTAGELLTFEENYRNHWNGWRFWLLP